MSCKLTNYKNLDFFNEIDTEEKAYWIGFICADGNVSKTKNLLQINLSQADIKHLQKLGDIFGRKIYVGEYYNKIDGNLRKYALLAVCNKHIKDDLIKNGVYPDKTKLDNINTLKYISNNLLSHFVRGYFDGDGCITSSNLKSGKINYALSIAGGHNFLDKLKKIMIDKMGLSNIKTVHMGGCDVIRWAGREQINLISQWMYRDAVVFMERKKMLFDKFYKDIYKRGSSNFRGVVWHKTNQKWLSSISYNKKRISLGYYKDEKEAAKAYDKAVIKYDKPVYKLNFNNIGA